MNPINAVAFKDPKSPVTEVYRTLRTNLKFVSFQKDVKTIAFTSSSPNEGKSTIVTNLGICMAQEGKRVMILEGDLRNPTIHKFFSLPNRKGLTNILTENASYKDFLNETDVKNLDVISCGPKPPNPAELLGSQRMKNLLDDLKQAYDYILIDTTPVIVVTDAALLASICDGTVLVVASGEALIDGTVKAKEILNSVNANILGVILNKLKADKTRGYYYYYQYNYGGEKKDKKSSRQRSYSLLNRRDKNV